MFLTMQICARPHVQASLRAVTMTRLNQVYFASNKPATNVDGHLRRIAKCKQTTTHGVTSGNQPATLLGMPRDDD